MLEDSDLGSRGIVTIYVAKIKVLISCAVQSAPLDTITHVYRYCINNRNQKLMIDLDSFSKQALNIREESISIYSSL